MQAQHHKAGEQALTPPEGHVDAQRGRQQVARPGRPGGGVALGQGDGLALPVQHHGFARHNHQPEGGGGPIQPGQHKGGPLAGHRQQQREAARPLDGHAGLRLLGLHGPAVLLHAPEGEQPQQRPDDRQSE